MPSMHVGELLELFKSNLKTTNIDVMAQTKLEQWLCSILRLLLDYFKVMWPIPDLGLHAPPQAILCSKHIRLLVES